MNFENYSEKSFEDILEDKGQTRLFKLITLDKELDEHEADIIIATTEKFLAENKNDVDDTL